MSRRKGLSFHQKKKKFHKGIFREILITLFGMLIVVFIGVVFTYFAGMYTNVSGASMEPGLHNGQSVYIDRFRYLLSKPQKGDIIVFLPNGNTKTHYYIKRVIAGPGDVVQIRNGICYVNEEPSPYITARIGDPGIAVNPLTVGVSEFFCLGDNPGSSEDSRHPNIGMVNENDIIGKAWFHGKYKEEKSGFVK